MKPLSYYSVSVPLLSLTACNKEKNMYEEYDLKNRNSLPINCQKEMLLQRMSKLTQTVKNIIKQWLKLKMRL